MDGGGGIDGGGDSVPVARFLFVDHQMYFIIVGECGRLRPRGVGAACPSVRAPHPLPPCSQGAPPFFSLKIWPPPPPGVGWGAWGVCLNPCEFKKRIRACGQNLLNSFFEESSRTIFLLIYSSDGLCAFTAWGGASNPQHRASQPLRHPVTHFSTPFVTGRPPIFKP